MGSSSSIIAHNRPDRIGQFPQSDIPCTHAFWRNVAIGAPDACWLWQNGLDRDGYGRCTTTAGTRQAHVAAFRLAGGTVPPGHEVDHTCRVRRCCNPRHLRAIPKSLNLALRKLPVICPRGHRYDALYAHPDGYARRRCRICRAEQARAYRARKSA